MITARSIATALLVGATVMSGVASANNPDMFENGQSFYGQSATPTHNARVVDVASAKYVNAEYGETLTFVRADKTFTWTFNGLDNRAVDLRKIAPTGFAIESFTVYVGTDPLRKP